MKIKSHLKAGQVNQVRMLVVQVSPEGQAAIELIQAEFIQQA
jgi:hypothetical protein